MFKMNGSDAFDNALATIEDEMNYLYSERQRITSLIGQREQRLRDFMVGVSNGVEPDNRQAS